MNYMHKYIYIIMIVSIGRGKIRAMDSDLR